MSLDCRKVCSYCGSPKVYAKGFCKNCYNRNLRNGTPQKKSELKNKNLDSQRCWEEVLREKILGNDIANKYPVPDDIGETIEYLLSTLTQQESSIILLRYKDGLKSNKIAEKMEITPFQVNRILLKARRKLKHISIVAYLKFGIAEMGVEQHDKTNKSTN